MLPPKINTKHESTRSNHQSDLYQLHFTSCKHEFNRTQAIPGCSWTVHGNMHRGFKSTFHVSYTLPAPLWTAPTLASHLLSFWNCITISYDPPPNFLTRVIKLKPKLYPIQTYRTFIQELYKET